MRVEGRISPVAENALRQVCAELERRLNAGDACAAESVFAAHPELSDDADAALEVIYTEFVAREQLGQRPAPDDFCARFPQWRQDLEQLFQIHGSVGAGSAVIPVAPPGTRFPDAGRWRTFAGHDGAARRIGNYELLGEVGRGGMGVVYKARQAGLHRLVALKMILTGEDAGPQERARFRAEAEAAARLEHPNIVKIHEVGEHDGRPFLSLEYVDGGSLEQQLTGTPWPATESARLVETLARAMHHAHTQGIVHRDLKPGNILLQRDEGGRQKDEREGRERSDSSFILPISSFVPKITDFGLARRLPSASRGGNAATALTAAGAILGTPAYMAPEQAAGDGLDIGPATDVYALGAILYELLTGRPPFQDVNILETLEQVRSREPLPPSRLLPGLARDIETICLKCLRKERGQRYENAAELAADLGRFQRGEPVHARPTPAWERTWKWAKRRPAVAALLALLVVSTVTGLTGVTVLWRQTAAALAAVKTERDEKETALAANLIALAHREWMAYDLDAARRHLEECPPAYRDKEWRYVERVCHAERARLRGHRGGLTAVAFCPDGRRLVSASNDETVKLWDLDREKPVWDVRGRYSFTGAVVFSTDGSRIVLVGHSGPARDPQRVPVVCGLDAGTGGELWRWQYDKGFSGVAVSPDQQHAALADPAAGYLRIVELPTGRVTVSVPLNPRFQIARQAFSPDGRRVASLAKGGGLLVWDAHTGEQLKLLRFPTTEYCQVAFSPNSRTVANACNDRVLVSQILAFDLESASEILRMKTPVNRTSFLSFSPDGRSLASASNVDREVFLWDVATGQEVLTFRGHLSGVMCLAFSPDGRFLATGGEDASVRIWETRRPEGGSGAGSD